MTTESQHRWPESVDSEVNHTYPECLQTSSLNDTSTQLAKKVRIQRMLPHLADTNNLQFMAEIIEAIPLHTASVCHPCMLFVVVTAMTTSELPTMPVRKTTRMSEISTISYVSTLTQLFKDGYRLIPYIRDLIRNDSVPQIRLVILVGKTQVVEAARAVIVPATANFEAIEL